MLDKSAADLERVRSYIKSLESFVLADPVANPLLPPGAASPAAGRPPKEARGGKKKGREFRVEKEEPGVVTPWGQEFSDAAGFFCSPGEWGLGS